MGSVPLARGGLHTRGALVVVALFVLALVPRAFTIGDFWTADEAKHWSVRVDAFWPAIERGDYAATNLVGHPGVTTIWLGTLGSGAHQLLADMGVVASAEDNAALHRFFLRLPVGIATALCIALAYPLLRRLFGGDVALLTALLWIGSPFLVAHSKVLHVDALLTSFILLSLLAGLAAFRLGVQQQEPRKREGHVPHWGLLVASGVAGGLALLTKSPSMILIPMTGLIALVGALHSEHPTSSDIPSLLRRVVSPGVVRLVALACAVWGGVAALVWGALWPAAWVDPLGSVGTVLYEVVRNGAKPHGWGNFFLGQAVEDPGPLFYPVAIVLRLAPWSMLGLLAAALVEGRQVWRVVARRGEPPRSIPALVLLLVYALLFIAVMSALAKKFDRYVLPTFPVINLVAAFGLIWLAGWGGQLWHRWRVPTLRQQRVAGGVLWGVLVAAIAATLAWYQPYEMAYYNPLPGGGRTAERVMYVGWGEGLEQAGRYIREQYNGCDLGVASWYELVILPYTCTPVLHQGYIAVPGHVHYAVLYINQVQREIRMDEILPPLRERGALVHSVRIHGIEYARVYQLRQPRQHELTAEFGSAIRLTGYDADTSALRSSGVLTLTLQWQARQEMSTDYNLFIHVFDGEGRQVGHVDVPPGGPFQPTSAWGHNRFIDWPHRVPLEVGSIDNIDGDGSLWATLGIYDPSTFERLSLGAHPPPPPGAPDDGVGTLVLNIRAGRP